MFTSLRARLWLTYAVIIILILSILGVSVFVYIIRNPLIDRQAIAKLDAARIMIQRQFNDRVIQLRDRQEVLERIGDSFEIRLILFDEYEELVLDSQPDESPVDLPEGDPKLPQRGYVKDQVGRIWLFSSLVLDNGDILLLTLPRQGGIQLLGSPFLRETLREDFLPSFIRAGLIASALGVIFAVWMGKWIASPLRDMEEAARSLPEGEIQQIPIKGPDEVRALASSYNEMVDKVTSSQQSQRDFVANVSHELKTPLTSIQGFSGAILDGTVADGPALQRAAEIIKTEADRMYRLVADLLDLARFDAGTISLDRQALDLESLLNQVGSQLIPQAVEAQVEMTLDIDPLPTVVGDEDRLSQVFTNLVDNAIKHTPANGFVRLSARSDGGQARVSVIDSGEGISDEHLSRIFERFYKVDGARKKETKPGTGLGLAIAQQIVQAHNGEIIVRSQVGDGTAFEVSLPIVRSDDLTVVEEIREEE
jgi:signal transduction histidine kinase